MERSTWIPAAILVAMLPAACRQDVNACLDCPVATVAVFDPVAGILPLPIDLAKAATGKLPTTKDVVAADGSTKTLATFPPPMKAFVDDFLNSRAGFPVEMPLTVHFSSGDVDPATLAGDSIRLYDVTAIAAALKLPDDGQRAAALEAATIGRVAGLTATAPVQTRGYSEDPILLPPTTWDVSVTPSRPLDPGRTYCAVVTTGVKDVRGDPIAAAEAVAFLKSRTPLVNDKGAATVFLSDGQVEGDRLAALFEPVRAALAPHLDALESLASDPVPRADVVLAWTFTTWPAQAVLDATSGVIPLPNDLVRTAPAGPIAIPVTDAMPAAFKGFVQSYLNTLDGFPQSMPISLPFAAGTVDTSSLAGAAVRVYDVTDLRAELAKAAPDLASVPVKEVTGLGYGTTLLAYAAASGYPVSQASVRPPAPWTPGHTFLAVATSAIRGPDGTPVAPPFVFGFAKVPFRLLDADGTPLIPASAAETARLEALRADLAPLLGWLDGLAGGQGVRKADVVLAWTFTTSAGNEALFDPTAGQLPFPNDVLRNPITGRVALPIDPADPQALKALEAGLNTLDGFGTNGPATTAFSLPLDPDPANLALIPDTTGFLARSAPVGVADITDVDPTDPSTLAAMEVYGPDRMTIGQEGGELVIRNVSGRPLPPNRRFTVIVLDTLKSAGTAPLPIHVSPVFWLARSELPLLDAHGKSQLPTSLSNADAALLEELRRAYQPFFDAVADVGITRDRILGFFTFTTGTTTSDLVLIDMDLPAPTKGSGTLKAVAAAGAPWSGVPTAHVDRVCDGCTVNVRTVLAEPDRTDPANPKGGTFRFDASGVPVTVARALPVEVVVPAGPGPFPIVLFQHGLDGSRKDVARIADDLAAAGLASVAIDLPFHGDHPIRIPDTASGTGFFTDDVFAVRDNLREGALDQAQVIRFLRDRDHGLVDQFPALDVVLDTTKVRFLGDSLGSIVGTLASGLVPDVPRVALVVPGGDLMQILVGTGDTALKQPLLDALAALGIPADGPDYLRFLALAQWALDRADPVNWARVAAGAHPGDRFRIVEAVGDEVIPNGTTEALATALGIPKGPDQAAFRAFAAGTGASDTLCHGFFLDGCPAADFPDLDPVKVAAAQAQARAFVIDFLKD